MREEPARVEGGSPARAGEAARPFGRTVVSHKLCEFRMVFNTFSA